MTIDIENGATNNLEGKYAAMFVCWMLGNGCLFAWNSILTSPDYYVQVFPKYNPTRVLTLVYTAFALGTLAILTYNEAKIDTRRRNILGLTIFFISALLVLVGGIGTYIGMCAISGAFGFADAHVLGGMVRDLSFMGPELLQIRVVMSAREIKHPKTENTQIYIENPRWKKPRAEERNSLCFKLVQEAEAKSNAAF